jgi:beta-glucosidase
MKHSQLFTVYCLLLILLLTACTSPDTVVTPAAVEPTTTIAATIAPTPLPAPTNTAVPEPTDPPTVLPYLDATQPLEVRVEDLLGRMTLEEKIGQMTLIEKNSITPDQITAFGIGAILSGGGGSPQEDKSAAGWLEMVSGYQSAALDTRLGIPLLYGVDAVHGHSNLAGATIFPHNIGLGATGNADLVREIGRITALETLATGIHWNYSPVLAVPQDVRWGRTYEGYSENTQLVDLLGNALLVGMQGDDLSDATTLLGTPKHWVADGGAEWGTSTTGSYVIDRGDARIDEATLRRVHIPPYITAIENGAMSVMISYSSWNGTKMHAQSYLINDVLKGELGFDGFIVSDWQAIDEIEGDYDSDVVTAINAGIDMNMVPSDYRSFIRSLQKGVEQGDISAERIDDAVGRILRVKFMLGLFEQPINDTSLLSEIGSPAHRDVARQAVRESLVLLKNENDTLPIANEVSRIFVAGQHADDVGLQSGGWTVEWQGFSGALEGGTSILEGLAAATDAEIVHDRFGKFEQVEGNAEIGIVVMGERPYAEGQGDRADLTISDTLIARMRERADKVIVILITGRPLVITEALPLADAWVVAWLPGSEGAGIADVLFGTDDFTGKLPFSWQRTMEQLPFDYDNLPTEGCAAPLFPFGYGLTYADEGAVSLLDCP